MWLILTNIDSIRTHPIKICITFIASSCVTSTYTTNCTPPAQPEKQEHVTYCFNLAPFHPP